MPEETHSPIDGGPPVEIQMNIKKNRKRSFGEGARVQRGGQGAESAKDMITPPNSTLRKTPVRLTDNCSNLKHPLSPELSSPIAPTRAKKQKSDGGSRSNGNLTIDELLHSLEQRRINCDMNSKPPYSYATLIGLAILQSLDGKLTLSQIYNWISVHFPYYKQKDAGWQNSIRHNLSLNEAFIKTEKSCDGKGHFWEVKSGYETKFFKGTTVTYQEVRQKLQDIDRLFNLQNQQERRKSDEEPLDESDCEFENNSVMHIHSSPNMRLSNIRTGLQDYHESDEAAVKNNEDAKNLTKQCLNPPYLSKKYHTSLGLPRVEDFNKESNLLFCHPNNGFITSSSSPSPNLFNPSKQDFKKYTCSFNSSFEELSPSRNKSSNGSLLDPVMTNSLDLDALSEAQERYSIQQSPMTVSLQPPSQHHQMDLLRTPRNSQQHNIERTPCRFITTPRDESSVMRKWQTPSHLFEDLYCSPIFKYMGTPAKETTSPNGLKNKYLSPRKLSAPDMNLGRSKISASGLFGVDVYAVWKRATQNSSVKNQDKEVEPPEEDCNNITRGDDNGNGEE